MDRHYTPVGMAQTIVDALDIEEPMVVADFAAGEGALLAAARERWPSSHLIASDIQPTAVEGLRSRFAAIEADVADFLSKDARTASAVLRAAVGRVCLVVLNPPFSCRGGARVSVELDGQRLTCSRAMAFLINSIPFITPVGRTVALLPASCLTSEKDAAAIEALSHIFSLERIGRAQPYDFLNCSVHVSFIILRRRTEAPGSAGSRGLRPWRVSSGPGSTSLRAALSRGSIPMHTFEQLKSANGLPFVHTTDLRDGLVTARRSVVTTRSIANGPVILMPRVGMPTVSKLCLIETPGPVAISDCIIALNPERSSEARLLFEHIKVHWSTVEQYYGGSCARYITLKRLISALQEIGVFGVISMKKIQEEASTLAAPARRAGALAA